MSEAGRKHKDRGAQLLAKGKLAPALEEFQSVVAEVNAEVGSRQKIAEILARLGRTAEAITEFEEVVARYVDQGQLHKAIAICKAILTLDPYHVVAQQSLAALSSAVARSTEQQPEAPSAPAPTALDSPVVIELGDGSETDEELASIDVPSDAACG